MLEYIRAINTKEERGVEEGPSSLLISKTPVTSRTLTEVLRHSGKGISLRLAMEDVNVENQYVIPKGTKNKNKKTTKETRKVKKEEKYTYIYRYVPLILCATLTEVLGHSGKGISFRLAMEDVNVENKYVIPKDTTKKAKRKKAKKRQEK